MAEAGLFWRHLTALPRRPLLGPLSPLQPLEQLGAALGGLELWCKRDDLIRFGLGGNKIRGLELLAADALAQRAEILVTGAGVQSNHVRATAMTAAYCGLRCSAVFWGDPPAQVDGNYRITRMLGAERVFTGSAERSSVDPAISAHCARLAQRGLRPYPIPRGGACALGALGHALAARELAQQCEHQGIAPRTIVLASGSGGTHAGWLLGSRALDDPWKIESYTVSRAAPEIRREIARLAGAGAARLGLDWRFALDEVVVHGGYIGAGYGIPSPEAAAAIRLLGASEGLLLDPTYTGKAMAGLLAGISARPAADFPLLFIHTGGEPAFFAGSGDWLEAGEPA